MSADDPYCRHRFDVDIGDGGPPLGFTEVAGLSVRVQARPDDGPDDPPGWLDWLDWNDRLDDPAERRPPASRRRTASPTLTLRRGLTDDRRLREWLDGWVAGTVDPRDVCVFLLDEAGERARGWRCRDATPVRWAGPQLVADRADVATETLELAHEGLAGLAGDDAHGD
jgi:hypothetical protein